MKINIFIIVFILLTFSSNAFAGSAHLEIQHGRLDLLSGSFSVTISGKSGGVRGGEFIGRRTSTPVDGVWLGVTAIINGEEFDFPVRLVKGKIKEKFTLSLENLASRGGGEIVWVANLWQNKIDSNACELISGSECYYCRKNGYHMHTKITSARENKVF